MSLSRYAFLVAAVFLGLALAGCPNQQEAPQTESEQTPVSEAAQVDVALGEWYVRLDPATIASGPVQFDIRNEGDVVHSFEVEGMGIEEVSRELSPGESSTMMVDLRPGTYDAYCPIGNHAERGMRTDLVVE